MELKEMIAELRDLADDNPNREGAAAAAEAIALVAWAEEVKPDLAFVDGYWIVLVDDKNGRAKRIARKPTLLGCIRAAKEAYEAQ